MSGKEIPSFSEVEARNAACRALWNSRSNPEGFYPHNSDRRSAWRTLREARSYADRMCARYLACESNPWDLNEARKWAAASKLLDERKSRLIHAANRALFGRFLK